MKKIISKLQKSLEKIDKSRDKALTSFIKNYWPRKITPNHLTITRIAIGLFIFVLLFYYKYGDRFLVLSLLAIGALTDMLDGSVARILKEDTQLGAVLDSTADRILIIPIAIYSLFTEHRWLFLLLILLEILNALISVFGHGKNMFIPSNIFGKTKMFIQSLVFVAILFSWPKPPNDFFIFLLWISLISMTISIFIKFSDLQNKNP